MQLLYEPIVAGEAVKFTVKGFPVEEDIRAGIEDFYKSSPPDTERKFLIFNAFKEEIYSGAVDNEGVIQIFNISPRPTKL
jgi:hypothetical protein